MYNLGNVVKFEIVRTLKKPLFWVAAILLPVLLVGYILLAGQMGIKAEEALERNGDLVGMKVALLDESGAINYELIEAAELEIMTVESAEDGVQQTNEGELNVFYHIPTDFAEEAKVRVYVNVPDQSLFANYQVLIDSLLKQSALVKMSPVDQVVMGGVYGMEVTSYVDGEEDNMIGKMIIPMVAAAIFYVLIVMFGNRLMMATLEEKENRISEMILTSISSKTLIVGKIISLIVLGFLQVLILVLPLIIGYLSSGNLEVGGMSIQEILPEIVWDPWMIVVSAMLLIAGYVLFTGLSVMIGALTPTAKEASNFAGVMMILVIMPVFFLNSFMSVEPDTAMYVLSYFPFSAPVALMMRNAFGTLSPTEAVIGLAVIVVSSVLVIWLAVRIFQYGAIEFSNRVRIRQALNPAEWKK